MRKPVTQAQHVRSVTSNEQINLPIDPSVGQVNAKADRLLLYKLDLNDLARSSRLPPFRDSTPLTTACNVLVAHSVTHVVVLAMEDGGDSPSSSLTIGGGGGLLPLFRRSPPPPEESLEEKVRRVSEENRRLAGALDAILADRRAPHLRALAPPAAGNAAATPVEVAGGVTASPRPKVRTVCARAEPADADANLLKDGYQWRKYGQKVTRDNPYPRSYFRCAYGSSCPVRKKVQRSAEDSTMLVATYEGEHNHAQSAQSEFGGEGSTSQQQAPSVPCSIFIDSLGRMITLGLVNQGPGSSEEGVVAPEFRKVLVNELVDLLKNDPELMESLISAVTARMLERMRPML
ncbi:hypothetical protein ACP4OV_024011 [Aristida adscensionis]